MKRLFIAWLWLGFCLTGLQGQTTADKKGTITFLQALQTRDGGFLPGPTSSKSSLRATSSALRALKYFGGEARDKEACAQFVKSCFDKPTGSFRDHPNSSEPPDPIVTAVGLMALVELKIPREDYLTGALQMLNERAVSFEQVRMAAAALESVGKRSPLADKWLAEIAKTGNADGSFGKSDGQVRATGSAVAAILRLGGAIDHKDNVKRLLKTGQKPDGAYGKEGTATSDLETSYRVIRSLVMLHDRPADIAKCRRFIATCRNSDGGYGVSPGQPSTTSATYFAGIILHWLAESSPKAP